MKHLSLFFLVLSTLLAHGKEHEHLHFFSSLHAEYFGFFVAGLLVAFAVYVKFYKDV